MRQPQNNQTNLFSAAYCNNTAFAAPKASTALHQNDCQSFHPTCLGDRCTNCTIPTVPTVPYQTYQPYRTRVKGGQGGAKGGAVFLVRTPKYCMAHAWYGWYGTAGTVGTVQLHLSPGQVGWNDWQSFWCSAVDAFGAANAVLLQ